MKKIYIVIFVKTTFLMISIYSILSFLGPKLDTPVFAEVLDSYAGKEGIYINYIVKTDTLSDNFKMELYNEATLIESKDISSTNSDDIKKVNFKNAESNHDYTVKIYFYDEVILEEPLKIGNDKEMISTTIYEEDGNLNVDYIISNYIEKSDYNIYVLDGNEIIESKKIKNREGIVSFDNVKENSAYEVVISAKYDENSDTVYTIGKETELHTETLFTKDKKTKQKFNEISTCKDLESIGKGPDYPGATHKNAWKLDGNYKLVSDIDCTESNIRSDNFDLSYGKNGFDPIGVYKDKHHLHGDEPEGSDEVTGFSGSFEGQGYSIDGIYMDFPENNFIGLFRRIENSASVNNFNITNATISAGNNSGILSPSNLSNMISNVHVDGEISAHYGHYDSFAYAGGLLGENDGVIYNCSANVEIEGSVLVGGLIGSNKGHIYNSYSSGKIIGKKVGGFVGYQGSGVIKNSYSSANVLGKDNSKSTAKTDSDVIAGSFIGYSGDYIFVSNSYSLNESNDFIGEEYSESIVMNSFSNGKINNDNSYSSYNPSNADLNDINFYEQLGLDEAFILEDVENGYYPRLDIEDSQQELVKLPTI